MPARPPGITQLVWLPMMSTLVVPAANSAWRFVQRSAPSETTLTRTAVACSTRRQVSVQATARRSSGAKCSAQSTSCTGALCPVGWGAWTPQAASRAPPPSGAPAPRTPRRVDVVDGIDGRHGDVTVAPPLLLLLPLLPPRYRPSCDEPPARLGPRRPRPHPPRAS